MGIIDRIRDYAATRGYYSKHEDEYGDDINDDAYADDDDDSADTGYGKTSSSRRDDDRMTLPPLSSSRSGRMSSSASSYASPYPTKVVDINSGIKMQLVLMAPNSVEDAGEICDYILANKIVSINLESVEHGVSQRIIDFLSGSAYALGGSIQSTGNRTFIIAPQSVDITGHLKEELKATSVFLTPKAASK